jgi:hypothetical protein
MRRFLVVAAVVVTTTGAWAGQAAAQAANPRASCLGTFSSFGGPQHLRAPIQHFLNEFFDQGAFISRAAKAHLGSDPACAEYAFGP